MIIKVSKSVIAYQATDRQQGTDIWVLVEDRVELAEVPACSILREVLDSMALYVEHFRLQTELNYMRGIGYVSEFEEMTNVSKRIRLNEQMKVVAEKINVLNEGASLKSDWSNTL